MTEFERIRAIETRRFASLEATYAECVAIAGRVWLTRLAEAAAEQQTLAETMRDRLQTLAMEIHTGVAEMADSSIPVPLFTPRDRAQFLKEVATSLLISADRQNLSVSIDSAPELPFGKSKGTPLTDLDAQTLREARDWALGKAPDRYAEFIKQADADLQRREREAISQPLTEPPLALAASGVDEEDFRTE